MITLASVRCSKGQRRSIRAGSKAGGPLQRGCYKNRKRAFLRGFGRHRRDRHEPESVRVSELSTSILAVSPIYYCSGGLAHYEGSNDVMGEEPGNTASNSDLLRFKGRLQCATQRLVTADDTCIRARLSSGVCLKCKVSIGGEPRSQLKWQTKKPRQGLTWLPKCADEKILFRVFSFFQRPPSCHPVRFRRSTLAKQRESFRTCQQPF